LTSIPSHSTIAISLPILVPKQHYVESHSHGTRGKMGNGSSHSRRRTSRSHVDDSIHCPPSTSTPHILALFPLVTRTLLWHKGNKFRCKIFNIFYRGNVPPTPLPLLTELHCRLCIVKTTLTVHGAVQIATLYRL